MDINISELMENYRDSEYALFDPDAAPARIRALTERKLAYDVKGFREGYMINQKLNLSGDKVAEFKRQIKLNENIIRTMFSEVK